MRIETYVRPLHSEEFLLTDLQLPLLFPYVPPNLCRSAHHTPILHISKFRIERGANLSLRYALGSSLPFLKSAS